MVYVLILLSMLVMASFTGYLPEQKGYRQFKWMVIGFFFGPLGLIASRCSACSAQRSSIWPQNCFRKISSSRSRASSGLMASISTQVS